MSYKTWFLGLFVGLSGMVSAQSRVLYDVRVPTPKPQISQAEWRAVNSAAQAAVAQNLWNDGRADGSCGDQELQVEGVAAGAFTTPNVKQTAYLYTRCILSHHFWQQGLVVMQGQQVMAHYVFHDLFTEMYSVKDINRNGYSELGMVRDESGQGTTYNYLVVTELRPTRRVLLEQQVNYNDCAHAGENNVYGWRSQVIRVTPSASPSYTSQQLKGRCNEYEPFQIVTSQGAVKALTTKTTPTGWVTALTR